MTPLVLLVLVVPVVADVDVIPPVSKLVVLLVSVVDIVPVVSIADVSVIVADVATVSYEVTAVSVSLSFLGLMFVDMITVSNVASAAIVINAVMTRRVIRSDLTIGFRQYVGISTAAAIMSRGGMIASGVPAVQPRVSRVAKNNPTPKRAVMEMLATRPLVLAASSLD